MNAPRIMAYLWLIVLGMTAASTWTLAKLASPDATLVHIVFDTTAWKLYIIPVVALLIALFFLFLLPRAVKGIERSPHAYGVFVMLFMTYFAAAHFLMLWRVLGHEFNHFQTVAVLVGLLMIGLGNYLGKIRQNAGPMLMGFGFRNRWTRSDEWVWDQAHRFGGRVTIAAGAVIVALALGGLTMQRWHTVGLLSAIVIGSGLIVHLRSFQLWRIRHRSQA